jgi:hypothetical protein
MKKDFIFDRTKNEYYHKDYPSMRFDKDLFSQMSDEDVQNYFQQNLKDLNGELNSLKNLKKQKETKSFSDEELKKAFSEIKQILQMESFKNFFKKKIHSNL